MSNRLESSVFPTVVVINFNGTAISSTSIYLSWSVPQIQGISVLYYILDVDEVETNRAWTFHAVEQHANIISLHPYYSYRCRVAVVGNTTTYPFSSSIIVTTHQAGIIHITINAMILQ